MKKSMRNVLAGVMLVLVAVLVTCKVKGAEDVRMFSPDGKIELVFSKEATSSEYLYSVMYEGEQIITPSSLGFLLDNEINILDGAKLASIEKTAKDETWEPVYGEKNTYRDNYNELRINFKKNAPFNEAFTVQFRAYNEGIALKYVFNNSKEYEVTKELTSFSISPDAQIWGARHAQGATYTKAITQLNGTSEQPMLVKKNANLFLAIGEAAMVDFSRMKLELKDAENGELGVHLFDRMSLIKDERRYKTFLREGEYSTPWRFVMVGKSAADILENNGLVLNLNEENQIEDPSFIKPGKVIREVTLTTTGGIACVDFCKKHNLQFIEFDAGWYGNEYDDASDATTVTVDPNRSKGPLDLHKVIKYAKKNDVGVILYVNRRSLEKQLDDVLPLLKSWGVDGLKYGFVNVGPQPWSEWLHDAVRKAADNGLMVDIHDEYRPTGYSRTYPNLMTQEGIRGDEERASNEVVINTMFTRMIAGAGDQTNCFLEERVQNDMGSNASQMAKVICLYSPWQFLYWYDRPEGSPLKKGGAGDSDGVIPELPELEFYDRVPTVWDDTKIIEGYPGEYAVVARKSGKAWYLGALTGNKARDFEINFDFLEEGKTYEAKIFADKKSLKSITNIEISTFDVDATTIFKKSISDMNGFAMIISEK